MHAGPISERRAGNDERSEQFRPERGQDHDGPAGLAIADHARLAIGIRMAADDRLDELGLCARDAFDGLSRHRLGQEAYEIAGVPCLHRHADFAVRLEAADPRTVYGPRVDDNKWSPLHIDFDAFR